MARKSTGTAQTSTDTSGFDTLGRNVKYHREGDILFLAVDVSDKALKGAPMTKASAERVQMNKSGPRNMSVADTSGWRTLDQDGPEVRVMLQVITPQPQATK